MSVIPAKEKDDIETQFDHSQVYLYELNAQKQPNKRPRHCMPYAVITWLKFNDGTEWPQYFDEPGTVDLSMLSTDSLQLALQTTEDVYLQTKLKALLKTTATTMPLGFLHQNGNGHLKHETNGMNGQSNGVHFNGSVKIEPFSQTEETRAIEETNRETNTDQVTPDALTNEFKGEVKEEPSASDTQNTDKQQGSGEELTEGKLAEAGQIDPVDTVHSEENGESDASQKPESLSVSSAVLNEVVATIENQIKPTEPASSPSAAQVQLPPSATTTTTPPAAPMTTVTSSGPTISPLSAHKTSLTTQYNKPYNTTSYRAHNPGYVYAAPGVQAYSPYAAAAIQAMPFHQRQLLQQHQQQQLQLQQLAAMQGQMGGAGQPGQMFLVRGPNGVQYLTSGAPQQPQFAGLQQQQHQQLLLAQLQQQQQQSHHQNLIAAQAAAHAQQLAQLQQQQHQQQQPQTVTTYAAAPTQYKQGI